MGGTTALPEDPSGGNGRAPVEPPKVGGTGGPWANSFFGGRATVPRAPPARSGISPPAGGATPRGDGGATPAGEPSVRPVAPLPGEGVIIGRSRRTAGSEPRPAAGGGGGGGTMG